MQTAVEAIHGPTDLAVPPPLCAARSCSQGDMSARTIDVKLQFDRFDGIAGPAARTFRRNLIQCGGRADDRGFSIADCLLREDEGALVSGTGVNGIPPMAQPGTAGIPRGRPGRAPGELRAGGTRSPQPSS